LGYRLQKAESKDAQLVVDLVNQHELTIDPESTPIGIEEAKELIAGFYDQAHANFLILDSVDLPAGFYSINPDANRKKLFTDVYARPGSDLIEEVIAQSLRHAAEVHRDYEHLFGVNSKDQVMRQALESFGMEVIRTYWHMKRLLDEDSKAGTTKDNVEIKLVSDRADLETWWSLHQDAFSKHFGFAPRPMDLWIEQTTSAGTMDPDGCFLAFYDGKPAGFVQMANANYHLNGGYVDLIGVSHNFQGQGLGQLLLQHAINFSIDQGREFIELNVDTGNESGALKLYEKLGFKPNSSWVQYENKKWAEVAKGL
jgi:ribosomal protein S18 acetylase RimI-like enzyme